MAKEVVALEFALDAGKANMTLGELEEGFESMQKRLREVGRGSEEFKQLSTSMAKTSAEIKNIELAFEGLDKEQVASELGSVAGGIGDITASLVLLGGENETMVEIAAGIEKAMAISMGFKGAIEGLSSANKLYNNLLKQGKVAVIAKSIAEKAAAAGTWILNAANKALNLTLKMNPIGLILIAITAVVGAIVYFKDSIMGLIDTALKPFQWAIDAVVDALQWLGIMESDAAIASAEAAEVIKKAEAEKEKATREAVKSRIKELQKLEDANRLLTDNLVADKDFEIAKLKAAGKDTTELERAKLVMLEKSYIEQKKLQIKRMQLLAEEMERIGFFQSAAEGYLTEERELKKEIAETEKELLETSHALEIFDIEVKTKNSIKRRKIKTEEAAENKKVAEKAAADEKKINEKAAADEIALLKATQAKKDEYDKLLFDAKVANEQEETERKRLQIEEDYQNNLDTLEEQGLLTTKLELELMYSREQALADIEKDFRLKKEEEEAEAREKKFALATAAVGALSALNSAALATDLLNAAGDEAKKEKLRKASFEREKKLNIAMALINGAQAVIAGFAQGGLPMAILAGVTAAAQLAAIVATTYQGGGGAAVTTPDNTALSPDGAGDGGNGVQLSPVSNTSTILGNQQVFVTETDITNTQNNVSVIEESATF